MVPWRRGGDRQELPVLWALKSLKKHFAILIDGNCINHYIVCDIPMFMPNLFQDTKGECPIDQGEYPT